MNPNETKESNPKDVIGSKKASISGVSMPFILGVGNAMTEGKCKYGSHNYRIVGVRLSVYVDAIFRHLAAMWEGQWIDPDSGLPHVLKIGACASIIFDAKLRGKLIDDRPPVMPEGWIEEANSQSTRIVSKFPNPVAPFLHTYDETRKESSCDTIKPGQIIEGKDPKNIIPSPPIR